MTGMGLAMTPATSAITEALPAAQQRRSRPQRPIAGTRWRLRDRGYRQRPDRHLSQPSAPTRSQRRHGRQGTSVLRRRRTHGENSGHSRPSRLRVRHARRPLLRLGCRPTRCSGGSGSARRARQRQRLSPPGAVGRHVHQRRLEGLAGPIERIMPPYVLTKKVVFLQRETPDRDLFASRGFSRFLSWRLLAVRVPGARRRSYGCDGPGSGLSEELALGV